MARCASKQGLRSTSATRTARAVSSAALEAFAHDPSDDVPPPFGSDCAFSNSFARQVTSSSVSTRESVSTLSQVGGRTRERPVRTP